MGWFNWVPKPIKQAAKTVKKVVVDGVEKVADDFLGIDDSGGIVGSVSKIGEKVEDGLREAVDELDKIVENPYIRLAVSIAYPPAAPYLNAYAKLDSGEKLNAADIAALAATAGKDFGAFEAANIDPEVVNNIKKGVQVATAENPGEALLLTYGADIAAETGLTEAFDTQVASTFGQDVLDVLKQNEDYIVDSARFATGNISEEELVAKYGAGAVDYATSGTGFEQYSKQLNDAIQVATGNKSAEEVFANTYGEDIVNYLGAETPNERALGLGGLTTATQLVMGNDPLKAAYAGTKRAYDEGARLEDLTFTTNEIAGLDFNLNDIIPDLGINFDQLKGQGYDLPSLANLDVNLNLLDIQAPDILTPDFNLPEVADLGLDLGTVNFEGYTAGDLGVDIGDLEGLNIDVGQLNIDAELRALLLARAKEGVPGELTTKDDEVVASLESPFDLPDEEPLFSREVLARTSQLV